uniref:PBPe domain-containing protein n=1 Tax=Macrostomum lignano TaxID=282301 RepID=A0A1I8IVE8_9PLAT
NLCRGGAKSPEEAEAVQRALKSQYEKLGPITFPEVSCIILFGATVLLWISRTGWSPLFTTKTRDGDTRVYMSDAQPALLMSILLFVLPSRNPGGRRLNRGDDAAKEDETAARPQASTLLTWQAVHERLPWGIVILLGGGFALAKATKESGLSLMIGDQLKPLGALPRPLMVLIVTYCTTFITEITSNTATASILLPILVDLCRSIRMNPLALMLPCTIAASLAFNLPVATPPNSIVFSKGYLTVADMIKSGFVLTIVSGLVVVGASLTYGTALFNMTDSSSSAMRLLVQLVLFLQAFEAQQQSPTPLKSLKDADGAGHVAAAPAVPREDRVLRQVSHQSEFAICSTRSGRSSSPTLSMVPDSELTNLVSVIDSQSVVAVLSPTMSAQLVLACNLLRVVCVGNRLVDLPNSAELQKHFQYVPVEDNTCNDARVLLAYLLSRRRVYKYVAIVASDCFQLISRHLQRHLFSHQVRAFTGDPVVDMRTRAKLFSSEAVADEDRVEGDAEDEEDGSELQQFVLFHIGAAHLATTALDAFRRQLKIPADERLHVFVESSAMEAMFETTAGQMQLRYFSSSPSTVAHVFGPHVDEQKQEQYYDEQKKHISKLSTLVSVLLLKFMASSQQLHIAYARARQLELKELKELKEEAATGQLLPARCSEDLATCRRLLSKHYESTIRAFSCPKFACNASARSSQQQPVLPTGFYNLRKLLHGVALPQKYDQPMAGLRWIATLEFEATWSSTHQGAVQVRQKNIELVFTLNEEDPLVRIKEFSGEPSESRWECKHGMACTLLRPNGTEEPRQRCCFGIAIDFIYLSIQFPVQLQCEKMFSQKALQQQKELCDHLPTVIQVADVRVFPKGGCCVSADNCLAQELKSERANIALGSKVVSNANWRRDFLTSDPYLLTSVSIVVNRTEKLSGRATRFGFLYPFDLFMWMCILATVHVAAVAAVIYEWLSPFGLTPYGRNRRRVFSFPSALTLTWSVLFSHTVQTKSPKCWSARFLLNIYAMFCLVFIASYTANLAAFMVGEGEASDIVGIHDSRPQESILSRIARMFADSERPDQFGHREGSGTAIELNRTYHHLVKHLSFFDTAEEAMAALGLRGHSYTTLSCCNTLLRVNHTYNVELVGKTVRQGWLHRRTQQGAARGRPGPDRHPHQPALGTNDFTDQMKQKNRSVDQKWCRGKDKRPHVPRQLAAGGGADEIPEVGRPSSRRARGWRASWERLELQSLPPHAHQLRGSAAASFCFGVLLSGATAAAEFLLYFALFPLLRKVRVNPACCLPIS